MQTSRKFTKNGIKKAVQKIIRERSIIDSKKLRNMRQHEVDYLIDSLRETYQIMSRNMRQSEIDTLVEKLLADQQK